MNPDSDRRSLDGSCEGRLNYLASSAESSLYRNGQLLLRRNIDGSDTGMKGVVFDERKLQIRNGRVLDPPERCRLDVNGFELLERPLRPAGIDFFDHHSVTKLYYPDCADIVKEVTGAADIFPFDHNVRSAAGKQEEQRIRNGQKVQGPASIAHGDYTLRSGPERLQQLAQPPGANDTFSSEIETGESLVPRDKAEKALRSTGRFSIVNVWRNISDAPVATHPLALCDAQTVTPEDLAVFEIHYEDRVGENYFSKHAPFHRWCYFPAMTRSEALLIKQWDSAGPLARSEGKAADSTETDAPCTFSFHSAFEDPATPEDAPARWSIEVRCLALFQ